MCEHFRAAPEEFIVLVKDEKLGLPGMKSRLDHLPGI